MPTLSPLGVVLRVVVSGLLGGVIGLERELRDQPAGFRTHILVSMGSACFTMVGAYGIASFTHPGSRVVSLDPTRVAAQVVTGIGFLGAGAIIRQGWNIRGLTTAAALWATAAVGVAAGLGFWTGGIATALATFLALYGLKRFEHVLVGRLRPAHEHLEILASEGFLLSDLARAVEMAGGRTEAVSLRRAEGGKSSLALDVGLHEGASSQALVEAVRSTDGVLHVEWERHGSA